MKTSRLLRDFLLSFVVVFVSTLLMAVLISFVAKEGFGTNVLGDIGNLIQGTLGVAVALAGAFVAIKIAALSYKIVDEQKHREDFLACSQIIESGLRPIVHVTKALQEIYLSQIESESVKSEVIKRLPDGPVREESLKMPLEEHERSHFPKLASALSKLVEALEEVATNPYASLMWQQAGSQRMLWLETLDLGDTVTKLCVRRDVHDIAGILRMRARQLERLSEEAHFSDIMLPRLTANKAKDGDHKDFDNRSLRSFLEAGADIWTSSNDGEITNVGAAILHDIACCIPDKVSEIESAFASVLGDVAAPDLIRRVPFLAVASSLGSLNFYGSSFGYTLEALKIHRPRLTISFAQI